MSSDPVPVHVVVSGQVGIGAVLDELSGAASWSLSDEQLRSVVAAGAGLLARLESVWLGWVRDLDGRPGVVAGARAGDAARSLLVHRLNRSGAQARRDVAAAHALDPDRGAADGGLPALAAAFAAGLVSRGHVDVAVAVGQQIPARLKRAVNSEGRSGAEVVDEFLTEASRTLPPAGIERLGRELLNVLDPDRVEAYDPDAHTRRTLSVGTDSTGMTTGRFQLSAAAGATVKTALDLLAAPNPAGEADSSEGQPVLVGDERTRGQRYADALTAMAQLALAAVNTQASEPARVLVIATADQVADAWARAHPTTDEADEADEADADVTDADAAGDGVGDGGRCWDGTGTAFHRYPDHQPAQPRYQGMAVGLAACTQTGPISPTTLARLACDAVLQAVVLDGHGAVLHLGREQRLASRAQRRALTARDRGCVIPACTAPPTSCDAHHLRSWSNGGGTDLDNLALACPRHHTDIHAGIWSLTMINGIPWAKPPHWTHPDQPLLRNTTHHTTDQARKLGQQLRLDLNDTS